MSTSTNNTTVLICDDNIAVHESLTAYLSEAHLKVRSAYTGEEALALLEKYKDIRFLILDLMLPGLFGLDVLKTLRKFSDIPVLILSSQNI